MNAREKLDEFAEINGMNKNQLIGWSVASDFAVWYAEQVKNGFISDSSHRLLGELREAYLVNVDEDGQPKASLNEIMALWKRVNIELQIVTID